jgi:hypothetical protein
MSSSNTPDTPPRHEYTSFKSLLKNSPKASDTSGSPQHQVKKKASGENVPSNAGWHLSSVSEEPGRMDRGGSRSRSGGGNGRNNSGAAGTKEKKEKEHMGLWKMMALTVSMAGSQVSRFILVV